MLLLVGATPPLVAGVGHVVLGTCQGVRRQNGQRPVLHSTLEPQGLGVRSIQPLFTPRWQHLSVIPKAIPKGTLKLHIA